MKQISKKRREAGLAHTGLVLAVIVLTAALALAGWWVWHKNSQTDKSTTNENSMTSSDQNQEEPQIPANFTVYDNRDFGFSFAYPEQIGPLSITSSDNPNVLLFARSKITQNAFAPHTQSFLDVEARKKEGYATGAGKYGPILEPKNGKWIVSSKENGDDFNGGYKIGTEYEVQVARTINSIPVYDFSFGDEGCYHTGWVFQLNNAFVRIDLPSVCADEIDDIPQDRLNSYKEVSEKVLNTLTIDK